MGISIGNIIYHNKYGIGVVLGIEESRLKIQFDNQKKNLKKISNRPFLNTSFPDNTYNIENNFDETVNDMIGSLIEKELDKFSEINMSYFAKRELRNFYYFKIRYFLDHKEPLRYNLLIQTEFPEEGNRFLNILKNSLKTIGISDSSKTIDESLLLNTLELDTFPSKYSFFGIKNCVAPLKDTVAIISSSARSEIQKKFLLKLQTWKLLEEKCNTLKPDCTVVAIGNADFVQHLKESNEGILYRFFGHRIDIKGPSVDSIIKRSILKLETNYKLTDEFKEEITKYINIVYSKADLKNDQFIDDLVNRVLVSYYLNDESTFISKACVPFYRKPKSFEEIVERLDGLVGLKKVKDTFKSIYNLSKDNNKKIRMNFTFVGNPGTGKTTVAKYTAELLYSMGIIKKNKLVSISSTDVISVYKGESEQLMMEKINEAIGGVLFIDEAYFLTSNTRSDSIEKKLLTILLKQMEDHKDNLTVIFAGYKDEIEVMLASNPGLSSRVNYTFDFEDYTDEELFQIFVNIATKENVILDKDAENALLERIIFEKTESNFGNARSIENIYLKIKSIILDDGRKKRIIYAEDIQKTMPKVINVNLEQMIGLASVKEEIKSFESRVRYVRFLQENNIYVPSQNMHMMFVGNPGTGKTTIAKKIANCLYEIGVLKTNKLVVAERKDLIESFVGGTAKKTDEVIKKAMNGVLFIDEAYSLYKEDNPKDFGTEAIETLITAMEEYKDKLVVVLAGYKQEMKIFQTSNPGIASRIGFVFDFPDYTPDELTEMYRRKLNKSGFSISSEALEEVEKNMEYFAEMKNFGNGRFVDKVIDMTINNRSKRSYDKHFNDISKKDIPSISELASTSLNKDALSTDDDKDEEFQKRIAIHEIGHALISKVLDSDFEIEKISIKADAASGGRTIVRKKRKSANTESTYQNRLVSLFGGRNAEKLLLGESCDGCYDDLKKAKELATMMVDDLGMGEYGITTPRDLLMEADKKATEILTQYKERLIVLSSVLLENGELDGEELKI